MLSYAMATESGMLPIRTGPVRFAVGPPDGLTSNAWRFWTTKHGDLYIACRDNFKEAKVSLHASGRWRMGLTTETLANKPDLVSATENRAWEVWDKPPASLPDTVTAFRLFFPRSELGVHPKQRIPREWKRVLHIEAPPSGKLTAFTVFITGGEVALKHESEPSFCIASLDVGEGRRAQLIAHGEPEGTIPQLIEQTVAAIRRQLESKGSTIPPKAYCYIFGKQEDGARFLVGAWMVRPPASVQSSAVDLMPRHCEVGDANAP